MSITEGLLIITGMTFAISMMVAAIIWLLSLYTSSREDNSSRYERKSFLRSIKSEFRYFNRFQKVYRTYWYSGAAPTNELIAFYHEQ